MRNLVLIFFLFIPVVTFSQKFSKSKSETIQNIKDAGYKIREFKGEEYSFAYTRYDQHGEAHVFFVCENNIIRQVVFLCSPPDAAPQRSLDILRSMTREEMKTVREKYGNWVQPDKSMITLKSIYYNGAARYHSRVYDDGIGEFTITFLN
jgi:hypothetical protein